MSKLRVGCLLLCVIVFGLPRLEAQTRWADDVRITDLTQNAGSPKLAALADGTLYVACSLDGVSSAGLYRSNDGGISWVLDRYISSTVPVTPISIVAAGEQRLFVSLRAGSGSSHELRVWWLDLTTGNTGYGVVATGDMSMQISGGTLCVDTRDYPDNWRVYIGFEEYDNSVLDTSFRFALSTDQGATWTNGPGVGGVEGDYAGIDLAYGHGALYYIYSFAWPFSPPEIRLKKSLNRGVSWGAFETVATLGAGSLFPTVVAAGNEPTVVACYDDGILEDLAVRVSYDAGLTWTSANPPNDPDAREIYPQLALCNQDEKLALAWLSHDGPEDQIMVSECALSSPTVWTPAESIVDGGGDPTFGSPSMVLDAARGNATCVAWSDFRDDPLTTVWFDSQADNALEELDQSQEGTNYGFWFDSSVVRWQEFSPTVNMLTSVEVFIQRIGNPGNIILEVRSQDEVLLGQETVMQEEVQVSGWVRVELSPEITLNTSTIYRISIAADEPSPDSSQRYFWAGSNDSDYNPACSCSVQEGGNWPTFDFAFRTWGYHDPVAPVTPQPAFDRSHLHANWPNPFNPGTTIAFDLPRDMAVSLRVYDVAGRLVDVLLDEEVAPQGRNQVVWRGRERNGRLAPAGVYFYRLEAEGYVETKRMTLLK